MTILLVEDAAPLRQLAARVLRKAGYDVLEASNGEDALDCAAEHPCVDLLITDVMMPKLGGIELARRLCASNPNLRVVYMSGYPPSSSAGQGPIASDAAWIDKPFSLNQLLIEVRQRLVAPRLEPAQM